MMRAGSFKRFVAMMPRMVVLVALPGLVACANVADNNADRGLSRTDAAYVRDICTRIMRVGGGATDFSACTGSLTVTARARIEEATVSKISADCRMEGFKDGTASFSSCVLDRMAARATAHDSPPTLFAHASIEEGSAHVPFIESSPDERSHRQQYACAQLGLAPGSEEFTQCLVDLGLAMDTLRFAPG